MIKHQTQPTFNTCMATCVAMIANVPAAEVIEEWHDKFHSGRAWLDDALDHYGILYLPGNHRKMQLINGFIYLATVPSLNVTGGLHQIVVVCQKGESPIVFDPAKGYESRMHYVVKHAEDLLPGEFNLTSWITDFAIPIFQGGSV